MQKGTITEGRGGLYTVYDELGNTYILRAKKKFRQTHITPLVGDSILFTPGNISDEHGWIEDILPRCSICLRPPVANISIMSIVIAPKPEMDLLLVDKLMAYAFRQHIKPLIIVNKCDLETDTYEQVKRIYSKASVEVLPVSSIEMTGIDRINAYLKQNTVCFCGQSGVGKSSLLNALCGLTVETGDISHRIDRGKNTTRHSQMFIMPDYRVIDTPGFSLLEESEKAEDPVILQEYYPEFRQYDQTCRFQPCYHYTEPGCGVLKALQEGHIAPERIRNYHTLLQINKERWKNRYG